MLSEHEPQASVSTAFLSSPKLSLLENTTTKKMENDLLTLIIKM